jgi:micrococcal nuclease
VSRAVPALLVAFLVVAGLAALGAWSGRTDDSQRTGRVSYVIDGDTIVVALGPGEAVHVRLIGIDTPEIAHDGRPGECYGARAARLTRRLALGRTVELQVGREEHDRYGRLLAYVRVDGGPADLELTLLERGAARTLAIAPNTDRAALYAGAQDEARRAGRGLWGACAQA